MSEHDEEQYDDDDNNHHDEDDTEWSESDGVFAHAGSGVDDDGYDDGDNDGDYGFVGDRGRNDHSVHHNQQFLLKHNNNLSHLKSTHPSQLRIDPKAPLPPTRLRLWQFLKYFFWFCVITAIIVTLFIYFRKL